MTRPARNQRLGVALAVALVFCACAGVARADDRVVAAPLSEVPAEPVEPPVVETEPVSEVPAEPVEPPVEVTEPVVEVPAEPPVEVTEPVVEVPAEPMEPPVEVTAPVSEVPLAPVAPARGDSIVVISSAVVTPGVEAAFSVFSLDSSATPVMGNEASAPRSDPGRAKGGSPSVPDPRRLPPGPEAPAPTGVGASGGSAGGFSGGLLAALVGFLILVPPGLGQVLSLSPIPVRAPTLVAGLERPD